jgi:Trypsin-co-occurring domain 2
MASILDAYCATGSVRPAAELLHLHHGSVARRLDQTIQPPPESSDTTMCLRDDVVTEGGMASGGHDEDWLDLADAIEMLRDQLSEAQRRGQDSPLRFVLGEITAEFEIELVRSKDGGGALKFGVVEADARRERSTRSTQRLTLRLNPEHWGGRKVAVGDDEE